MPKVKILSEKIIYMRITLAVLFCLATLKYLWCKFTKKL